MEYIIFISTIAATGVLVLLVGKVVYTKRHRGHAGYFEHEPAPPRKRTVSGQSRTERAEEQFKARLDAWQTRFYTRRHLPSESGNRDSLEGEKYTFVPPEPRQKPEKNGQVFQLLSD